jgi:hypothetical protein
MGFIFAVHVPIAGLALLPLILGLPIIFSPIHIAFLEMVIDPVCTLVFEAETEEEDVMRRPPRPPSEPLFSWPLIFWSALQGVLETTRITSRSGSVGANAVLMVRRGNRARRSQPERHIAGVESAIAGQPGSDCLARVLLSLTLTVSGRDTKQIDTGQKTAGCFITPASPRAWAACRAVRRPRGDATPPTPRWLVRGNSVRRSCRWQRRRVQESLRSPSRWWSRMSDRNERSVRCRFRLSAPTP